MPTDAPQLLDFWDLIAPAIPPRSRLFCLPPVGIGTAAVESLTGYVGRLALAHGVAVRRLVEEEILPLLGRPYLLSAENRGRSSSFWQDSETRALNGTGTLARDLVRALETLTGRDDLRFLTLRPWAEVVPVKGLLRHRRAWCPACYTEWRQAGAVIYEPLLWVLAPVTACPRHRRRLQQACPYRDCRPPALLLGQRSRPGHCAACGRWLGIPAEHRRGHGDELTDAERPAQEWVGEAIGELLAGAPGLSVFPTRPRLTRMVTVSVDAVAAGNVTRFARELGLSTETVWQWRRGLTVPSLGLLLQTGYRLGTTPWRLLTAEPSPVPRPAAERPRIEVAGLLDVPRRPPSPRRRFDVVAMRRALEEVLAVADEPPPPMRQVAKRLGHGHAELIQHLPELCHAISARYLTARHRQGVEKKRRLCAEVRQAAVRLHAQGLYPSACRIAPMISQPGFVRDTAAIAERREVLRELGWRT